MPHKKSQMVLYLEIIGFSLILFMQWLDEAYLVPEHLIPDWVAPGAWHEAILSSLVLIAVAVPVVLLTARLLRRLFYLESFVRICAWCRKINVDDRWMLLEEYLASVSDVECSHGICADCSRKFLKTLGK